MTNHREIVQQLLSRTDGATQEQAEQIKDILTPNPNAAPFDANEIVSALRASRGDALAVLLARLPLEKIAAKLGGGDEARAHVAAVLNAPFPPRAPLTREFNDAQSARIQALEECVLLMMVALVEVLHPSPRDSSSTYHSTASRRH
jgi:hypothetical protein